MKKESQLEPQKEHVLNAFKTAMEGQGFAVDSIKLEMNKCDPFIVASIHMTLSDKGKFDINFDYDKELIEDMNKLVDLYREWSNSDD